MWQELRQKQWQEFLCKQELVVSACQRVLGECDWFDLILSDHRWKDVRLDWLEELNVIYTISIDSHTKLTTLTTVHSFINYMNT